MHDQSASKSTTSHWLWLLGVAVALSACSVDKGKYEFVPDDQFNAMANAGNSSGGDGTGGGANGHGHGGGMSSDAGAAGETSEPPADCTLGEHFCSADGHLLTCKAGTPPAFDKGVDCGSADLCSETQGICLKCSPGEFQCSGATLQQCNIFGSAFEDSALCDSKTACIASGQKGYCVRCKAASVSCESVSVKTTTSLADDDVYAANRLLTCNIDGSGTDTSQVCEADQEFCNAAGKTCTRCAPGAFFCDGATLNLCDTDGQNYSFKATCQSSVLCDAANGACKTPACNVGQFQCDDAGGLQACDRGGNWQRLDTCASKAQCDINGAYYGGRCQPCLPGSNSCVGGDIQGCVNVQAQNTPYTYQSCAAGMCTTSVNGATCGQCKVGTIQCAQGNPAYSLCLSPTTYSYNSCPTGQVCNPAAVRDSTAPRCVTCTPGTFSCDNTGILSKCADDGSGYTVAENCQASMKQCDAGRGLCVQAFPGYYGCEDNGDLTLYGYDSNHALTHSLVEHCASKNLCDQYRGSCRKTSCAVGETTCSGGDVYSCDTGDSRRRTGTHCATTTRCQDGFGCVKTLAIAAGDAHTCAVVAGSDAVEGAKGYMLCWGANESGQLGDGSAILSDSKEARQVLITNSDNNGAAKETILNAFFTGVCAGKNFTCGDIAGDNDMSIVACWGSNEQGQLGANLPDPGPYNSPFAPVSDGTSANNNGLLLRDVTCGSEFACALGADGTAYCWGANESGQQGTGSVGTNSLSATAIDGHLFTQLSAGARHVCGIQSDNTVWCWGDNSKGQLGTGDKKSVATPVLVGNLSAATDRPLALGNDFSLALSTAKASKSPFSWGSNLFGQLGNGTNGDALEAGPLSGLSTALLGDSGTLYAGSTSEHACARIGDTLQCWGANVFGELGDKTTVDSNNPVLVLDGKTDATKLAPGAHSVAVGGRHTCAINAKGDVMCWGANHHYQLGSSALTPQRTPLRGY
jgi:alpha-tubulin suppressor-like RCC1 family protein